MTLSAQANNQPAFWSFRLRGELESAEFCRYFFNCSAVYPVALEAAEMLGKLCPSTTTTPSRLSF